MAEFDRTRMLRQAARQNDGYARRDQAAIRNSVLGPPSRVFKEAYLIAALLESVVGRAQLRRILEVGCGTGTMTLALRAMSDAVVAIDLSDAAIATAREQIGQVGGVTFAVADGTDPMKHADISQGGFDAIVFREFHPFTRTFYGARDLAEKIHRDVLREYCRLLAPSGTILIIHAEYNDQVIRPDRLGLESDLEIAIARVDPRILTAALVLLRHRLAPSLALTRIVQPFVWAASTRNVIYALKKRA